MLIIKNSRILTPVETNKSPRMNFNIVKHPSPTPNASKYIKTDTLIIYNRNRMPI